MADTPTQTRLSGAGRARRTLAAVAEVVATRLPYDGGTEVTAALVALCRLYLHDLPEDEARQVLELAGELVTEYDQHASTRAEA